MMRYAIVTALGLLAGCAYNATLIPRGGGPAGTGTVSKGDGSKEMQITIDGDLYKGNCIRGTSAGVGFMGRRSMTMVGASNQYSATLLGPKGALSATLYGFARGLRFLILRSVSTGHLLYRQPIPSGALTVFARTIRGDAGYTVGHTARKNYFLANTVERC